MKRLLRSYSSLACALLALSAVTACGIEDEWSVGGSRSRLTAAEPTSYHFCSSIATELRGLEVTVYAVKDATDLVVLQHKGSVLCVDYPEDVREVGVIPVSHADEPACSFCDGTPLPADVFFPDATPPSDPGTPPKGDH